MGELTISHTPVCTMPLKLSVGNWAERQIDSKKCGLCKRIAKHATQQGERGGNVSDCVPRWGRPRRDQKQDNAECDNQLDGNEVEQIGTNEVIILAPFEAKSAPRTVQLQLQKGTEYSPAPTVRTPQPGGPDQQLRVIRPTNRRLV